MKGTRGTNDRFESGRKITGRMEEKGRNGIDSFSRRLA